MKESYYLGIIKHLLKIYNLWNYVVYVTCLEWDCYPEDVEEFFLYEGLMSVGIRI